MCKIELFYGLSSDNPQSTALCTLHSDCSEKVISKLVSNQMGYFICPVKNNQKINVFLGTGVCMKVLTHKPLNKLSVKEDFTLGATLGYGNWEKKGISVPLFLLLYTVYSFEDYFPETNTLAQITLGDLKYYLIKSHKDYLKKRMPKIIMKILKLVDDCGIHNGRMLMECYKKYLAELIIHFDYKEQTVFLYIKSLQRNETKHKYMIKEYKVSYNCFDAAMNNLRNIILKYILEDCPNKQCQDILINLFLFKSDLNKPNLLEGKILITFVKQIVRKLDEYQTK